MLKTNFKNNRYILFFLFGIVLLIYFLNLFTPMILDDCSYTFGPEGRIKSLTDIIKSQTRDYTQWSGRVIPHAIVQFFCGITGKWLFNILNPVMYAAFIFLLCKHINELHRNIPPVLLFFWVLNVTWFFLPDQFITTLMIAGSLNYLWSSVLILGYIWFFTEHAVKYVNPRVIHIILFFLFSLLCGAFVEFYSVSVFIAVVTWLFVNRIKPNKTVLFCLAGFFIGLLFIVLAPGNYARMESMEGAATLGEKISTFVFLGIFDNKVLWILGVLVVIFLTALLRRRITWLFFRENTLYITAIIVSLGFGFVSGAGWARVFFPVFVFSIILFFKLLLVFRWNRLIVYVLSVLLLAAFVYSYRNEIRNIQKNKAVYDNLVFQIPLCGDAAVLRKESNFIESKNTFTNEALQIQSDFWTNKAFAKYYGRKSASILPSSLYDSLYTNPYYVEEQYKILENCFTASNLDYYIVPLDSGVTSVKKVVLSYEDSDQTVVRPTILMLVGNPFVVKQLERAMSNGFCSKIFFKRKPSTATFTINEGGEPYAVLWRDSVRYLIVKKPTGYKDDVLIDIKIGE